MAMPYMARCPLTVQDVKRQLKQISSNARLAAFIAPFAAASSDSLTAVYTRTFERAAFGFAKVMIVALHKGSNSSDNSYRMPSAADVPISLVHEGPSELVPQH